MGFKMRKAGLIVGVFFCAVSIKAQTVLNADGEGDTYELINSVLATGGGNVVEVPDCNHGEFGRHIDEVYDDILEEWVFRFHIHVTPDNDRCINFDRQRNEIKTYSSSPDSTLAYDGQRFTYNWKFKLDEGHQSSSSFTHIHQIKAVGGSEASMPLITLTTRAGTPDKLQVRYAKNTSQTTIEQVDLTPFKGAWVQAHEVITYGESGTYYILLTGIESGDTLLEYSNYDIRMWKTGASFLRPKWGIYRSLNNSSQLRDEMMLFNEFYILREIIPDTIAPTVQLTTNAAEPVTSPFEIKIDFNEKISGLSEEDFILESGTIKSGSLHTYNYENFTAQIIPLVKGTIRVQLSDSAAVDEGGNYSPVSNMLEIEAVPDTIAPTVEISTGALEPVSDTFEIAINFSEEISGLEEADFIIDGGVIAGESLMTVDDINFTARVIPLVTGTVSIELPDSAVVDANENYSLASNTFEIQVDLATSSIKIIEDAIHIYPNPVKGNSITIFNSGNTSNLELKIVNILGKQVFSSNQLTAGSNEYDLSALPNGNYIAQVYNGSTWEHHHFIINR